MTEPMTAIPFDGKFFARVVQGAFDLATEIKFNANLEYEVVDKNKLDSMFGGELPIDIMKQEASFAVEKTFTRLFEAGVPLEEIKYKVDIQTNEILQDSSIAQWEERCGVRVTNISDMLIQIDPKTEKLLSDFAIMSAVNPVSPPKPVTPAPQGADGWKCTCGNVNSGKFCTECGSKKPEDWVCSCGNVNKGKFCTECGTPKK